MPDSDPGWEKGIREFTHVLYFSWFITKLPKKLYMYMLTPCCGAWQHKECDPAALQVTAAIRRRL